MAALVSKDSGVEINRHALGVCMNQTVVGNPSTTRSYKNSPENREWVSVIEAISAASSQASCLVISNHCKAFDSSMTRPLIGCTLLLRMGSYSSLSQIEMAAQNPSS